MDQNFTRYAAQCETNGHRVEIITTENINKLLGKMMYKWIGQFGGQLPKRVLFIRADVTRKEDHESMVKESLRRFGRLDMLADFSELAQHRERGRKARGGADQRFREA